MQQYKPWTAREMDLIKKHYPKMGAKGMWREELLPGRSYGAILRRAKRMRVRFYSQDERSDQRPRNHYNPKPIGIQDPFLKRVVCGPWR